MSFLANLHKKVYGSIKYETLLFYFQFGIVIFRACYAAVHTLLYQIAPEKMKTGSKPFHIVTKHLIDLLMHLHFRVIPNVSISKPLLVFQMWTVHLNSQFFVVMFILSISFSIHNKKVTESTLN